MPTYEYVCRNCGCRFEKFQMMSDEPLTVCHECGGFVERLIGTGSAVIFKGAGSSRREFSRSAANCGRDRPCCGRDEPCDSPPCEE